MNVTPMDADESGDGWHLDAGGSGRRWPYVVGAVLLLALAALPITVDQYVIPALLVGTAIAMLIPLFLKAREPMQPVRYGGAEGNGLLLPTFPMRMLAILVFALFGSLLIVAGLWIGVTALREHRPGMLVGTVIAVVLGAVAMSGAWFGVHERLRGSHGVLLTENGVSFLTQGDPMTVYWAALTGVRPHWTRGSVHGQARLTMKREGPETFRNWLSFEATDFSGPNRLAPFARTNAPTVSADDLGVDPHTVLAVCRFYIEHPEARSELATPAVLDRVRQLGNDVDGPQPGGA